MSLKYIISIRNILKSYKKKKKIYKNITQLLVILLTVVRTTVIVPSWKETGQLTSAAIFSAIPKELTI